MQKVNILKKYKLVGFLMAGLLICSVANAATTIDANTFTNDGALTITGAATSTWSLSAGNLSIDTAATGVALNLGPSQTTSTITLGGTATTGALVFGRYSGSSASTINIASGATTGAQTITIGNAATGSGTSLVTIGVNTAGSNCFRSRNCSQRHTNRQWYHRPWNSNR